MGEGDTSSPYFIDIKRGCNRVTATLLHSRHRLKMHTHFELYGMAINSIVEHTR